MHYTLSCLEGLADNESESAYCEPDFSSTALKPVALIISRSLVSVTFSSSYSTTASFRSRFTSTFSTPGVAFNAFSTDPVHLLHFIPSTLIVDFLVAADALIKVKATV